MFEVKQEGSNNMGLVCDQTANGLIAVGKNGFSTSYPDMVILMYVLTLAKMLLQDYRTVQQ